MTERVYYYPSREAALVAAIAWLEARGGAWGPYHERLIGDLGRMTGREVGVWIPFNLRRLRLDYDPDKGWHYNAEAFRGARRQKAAFCFPQQERRGCEDCEDTRGATDCDTLLAQIAELTDLVEQGQRVGPGSRDPDVVEEHRQNLHQNKARLSNRISRYEARCATHEAPNRQAILDRGRNVASSPLPDFQVQEAPREPGGVGCGCGCGVPSLGGPSHRQRILMGRPMLAV
ncbi:MAG: hypothetical protein AAGA56_12220 [Myxococcota bacterium]